MSEKWKESKHNAEAKRQVQRSIVADSPLTTKQRQPPAENYKSFRVHTFL